jgi:hypothetical protein
MSVVGMILDYLQSMVLEDVVTQEKPLTILSIQSELQEEETKIYFLSIILKSVLEET